jgi:hypothetical protein
MYRWCVIALVSGAAAMMTLYFWAIFSLVTVKWNGWYPQ